MRRHVQCSSYARCKHGLRWLSSRSCHSPPLALGGATQRQDPPGWRSAGSTIVAVIRTYKTIDAHVGGQPLRLIVEGMPRVGGQTLLQKRDWMRKRADSPRRALVLEPRGHAGMVAAVLTEPASPQAHAGLLF